MTCIKISDLTTAGSESLASADSFLNELGKTETTQIFGGWHGGGCYEKKDDYSWKKDDYSYEKEDDYSYEKEDKCDYSYKEEKHNYNYYCCWKKEC